MTTPVILDSAMAGLRNAQAGILSTSQNVAGAAIDGYVRRRPDNRISSLSPASIELNGTAFAAEGFSRYYNGLLQTQLLSQKSQSSYTRTLTEVVSTLDSMLIDPATSVSSPLGEMFNAAGSLSNDSTSVAYQQSYLGAATRASDRIRMLADEIANIKQYASEGLANVLNEANSIVPQLAAINGKIRGGFTPGFSYPSPDLLDERDRLTQKLQEIIGGQTIINDDGTANYFVGGMQLVDRDLANSFSNGSGTKPVVATTDVTTLRLRVFSPNWESPKLIPIVVGAKSQLQDGQAGAYINLLQNFAPAMERGVDLLALSLMTSVNSVRSQALNTNSPNGLTTIANADIGDTVFNVSTSLNQGTDVIVGQRLYVNGLDQGVRVSAINGTQIELTSGLINAISVGADISFRIPALKEVKPVFGYQSTISDSGSITNINELASIFKRNEGYSVGDWSGLQQGSMNRFVVSTIPEESIIGMTIYIDGVSAGRTVTDARGSVITASGQISASSGSKVEFYPEASLLTACSPHPLNPSLYSMSIDKQFNIDLLNTRVEYYDDINQKWKDAGHVVYADGALLFCEPNGTSSLPVNTNVRFIRGNTFEEVLDHINPVSDNFNEDTLSLISQEKIDARIFAMVSRGSSDQFSNLDAGAARIIESSRNDIAKLVTVVVTDAANTVATWKASNDANTTLEKSLLDQKETISGVNLDEEAANLVKYQQLYNASSKLLQAGRQMFDTLLSMLTLS